MQFFTQEQEMKLLENGRNSDQDHAPVAKLHIPGTRCVWLLSELMPYEPEIAFGLCDLGMGFPELGYVSLQELASINIGDLVVQGDAAFIPEYPMSVYAEAARNVDAVTEDKFALVQAKATLEVKRKCQPNLS